MKLLATDVRKWGLFVFAIAFAVRLINLIFLANNDPAFYFPQVDSAWHHNWAVEIAAKNFWGSEVFFRGPLYPYFLALIYKIFGVNIFLAKTIQIIGSSITCVLIYLLARRVFNETVARIASLMIAFYGTIIYYDSELLIEWLPILLSLLMLILMIDRRESLRFCDWLIVGILGGLAAIARPNVLVVFPVYFIWLMVRKLEFKRLWNRLAAPLGLTVGVILCVLPVTLRNYLVAGDFVLISSQGGVNLYLANNPDAEGLTMRMPEIKLDLAIPWNEFVDTTDAYAESSTGREMLPSEISDFWNKRALEYITSHPGDFLKLTAKRVVYVFSGFENSDQADIYQYARYSPILGALIFDHGIKFPFGIIAPLSILGFVLSFKIRRQLIVLYIFMICYLPTIIFFLVTARHRLAIIVILIIFAAYAIAKIYESISMKRIKNSILLMSAFLVLLVALNQTPFDLGFGNPLQFYYQQGIALEKQGKLHEAIASYREAVAAAPSAEVYNNLGFALAKIGNTQEAYQAYHHAIGLRQNFADGMNNLGLLFLKGNQPDSAELYFLMANRAAPGKPQVYLNLGDLYYQIAEAAKAESLYLQGIRRAPEFEPTYNSLANLYLQRNRSEEAARYLEQILKVKPDYVTGNVNYANILFNSGQYDDAKKHYLRALHENPRLVEAHFNLAVLYLRTNRPDSGRAQLERTLEIDPNYVPAKQALEGLKR